MTEEKKHPQHYVENAYPKNNQKEIEVWGDGNQTRSLCIFLIA